MDYLIIWILFGLVAMIVASTKERSGCGWFLIGCLIGPFSLVVALLPSLKTDPAAPNPETHVRCPDCKEFILNEAAVCKHCGCKLVPLSQQPTAHKSPPLSSNGMKCDKDCINAIIIVVAIGGGLWLIGKSMDAYQHHNQKAKTQANTSR